MANALGVAVPSGLEHAFHAACLVLDKVEDDEVIAQYDVAPEAVSEERVFVCQYSHTPRGRHLPNRLHKSIPDLQLGTRLRGDSKNKPTAPPILRPAVLPTIAAAGDVAPCLRGADMEPVGSQQLGGVYFFYGTAEFARQLPSSSRHGSWTISLWRAQAKIWQ